MQSPFFGSKYFPRFGLGDIFRIPDFRRKRVSSYDRTGDNIDFIVIRPGETRVIFDEEGPGCITHIWCTHLTYFASAYVRNLIIRIWWDDEPSPSVECPLGDFFGLGHGKIINFNSLPFQMSPQKGKGMNSWWPMPFKKHARIEIENDNSGGKVLDPYNLPKIIDGLYFYYYIDFEVYNKWPYSDDEVGYFHCQFRKVDYRKDIKRDYETGKRLGFFHWQALGGKNTRDNGGYDRNHVILDAEGKGVYMGCHIDIDNRFRKQAIIPGFNWPGEGDDMIFIDSDVGKEPTLYGTGTEDYVNTAYCPTEKYDGLFHGVILGDWKPWGKVSYYRYHIPDPVPFKERIKVTIEHGHNNLRGDIWETTAYWYQIEPHKEFPPLPPRKERMPRSDIPKIMYKGLIRLFKISISFVGLYFILKLLFGFY